VSGESSPEEPILIAEEHLERELIDFEQGMSHWPSCTIAIAGSLIAAFAWQCIESAGDSGTGVIQTFALDRESVRAGQWWRLLTCTGLHGGFGHLFGNLSALYVLGMALEHAVGPARVLVAYLVSGIGGSLLSIALNPGPSVGASGAVFGMLGMTATVLFRHRTSIAVRDRRIYGVLVAWMIYSVATGLLSPMIDNGAHIGGLVTGILLGLGLGGSLRVLQGR
jgi:rhomboid protease GluP